MKKYTILLAGLLAIVAVSACQKQAAPKPVAAPAAPAADAAKPADAAPAAAPEKKEEKKK